MQDRTNAIWRDLNAQSLEASDREATCRLGRSLLVTSIGALEDLCLKYNLAKLSQLGTALRTHSSMGKAAHSYFPAS